MSTNGPAVLPPFQSFPALSLSHPSSSTLPLSPFIPPSLRSSRPLPPTNPTSVRGTGPHRPDPLRITRQKAVAMEAVDSFTIPDTTAPAALSPAPTAQLPNTASTSASIPGGDRSLYLSTPPLSDTTSSPPLSSNHPSSLSDKSPRPRPESVQFGPRAARNSKTISSSVFLEQQRGVQVASPEEFSVPNASYPVVSISEVAQSIADEPHPLLDIPPSPTPSLPNPYTTTLKRNQTTSSVASSTLTSASPESGQRPRPKPSLTLNLPDSKPSVSVTTIAINETDTLLPNPYQPQVNLPSYFSPHTPAHPLIADPPILTGATSSLGANLNPGFSVSYFSPHTPAATGLLSSLGTGNTTATGTGPAKRERQGGLLAPPPTAGVGSYWSPPTPNVPGGLESAIEGSVVEKPEDVPGKDTEYPTATSAATDGHSAGLSHRDSSPQSSNEAFADADLTTSDSSSQTGSNRLIPNKSSKPQLTLQTWDLEKMREEKKKQDSTAARRQGSKDKDARNRERKGVERTGQRQNEAGMAVQVIGAIKGGIAPLPLKPSGPVAPPARPPQQRLGSTNTLDGRGKSEQASHPAALRPGSQFFQLLPASAQRTQLIPNPFETSTTQGNGIGADLTQNSHTTATTTAWEFTSNELPLTLHNPYLSLNTKSNPGRDWSTHGRTPSAPNVPGGGKATAEERKRFGFFGNAGAAASDTNLVGIAASTAPAPGLRKPKDDREANVLGENRKSAFYSRGINASFEALAGWGGKVFSQSSTTMGTHGHGQPGKMGDKDEQTSYHATARLPAAAHPRPYSQSLATQLPTPPLTDTQRQHATPPSNPRVYPAPSHPPGERGPSFGDYGVEIGYVGRNRTHTPPGAAEGQQVKKGHTKNSSSGVGGLRKMFGFGKKDKDKDKQKWI